MRLPSPMRLSQLFNNDLELAQDCLIEGLSDPEGFQERDCVFCFDAYQLSKLLNRPDINKVACIIGPVDCEKDNTSEALYVPVKKPRLVMLDFLQSIEKIMQKNIESHQVHPTAIVSPSVTLGINISIGPYAVIQGNTILEDGVHVGAHCVIESDCRIGKSAQLHPHVVIKARCSIGEFTEILSHSTIGANGFGFERVGPAWKKIPHLSGAVIGSHCFIGSHVAVAAGALFPTVIGSHVIIDNHVQIAHHVKIGSGCAIAGSSGVAGSTHIGENCLIGGAVSIGGHLKISDQVSITGMTMVTKSLLSPGVYSSGMPVDTNASWKKKIIALNRLERAESKRIQDKKIQNKQTMGESE